VAGGKSSTTALAGSTEAQQFSKPVASEKPQIPLHKSNGHKDQNSMNEVAAT